MPALFRPTLGRCPSCSSPPLSPPRFPLLQHRWNFAMTSPQGNEKSSHHLAELHQSSFTPSVAPALTITSMLDLCNCPALPNLTCRHFLPTCQFMHRSSDLLVLLAVPSATALHQRRASCNAHPVMCSNDVYHSRVIILHGIIPFALAFSPTPSTFSQQLTVTLPRPTGT